MKSKDQLIRNYLVYLYEDMVDDEMYIPEVNQSRLDFSRGYDVGEEIAQERQSQRIKDKLNHLKSDLAQEKIIKPSKIQNTERITELEKSIKLLEELI